MSKITRMIFVRHGESQGNLERHFYGNFDKGLTDLGRAQANAAGEYILENYKLDKAYASDLGRAYETGTIIAAKQGLSPIPYVGVREIYAGIWEDMHFDEIAVVHEKEYSVWKTDIYNARPNEGEPVKDLCLRVRDAVWAIAEKNIGKTVLVATHATPIRSLVCEWNHVGYECMKDFPWVMNASVSVIDYDIEAHTVTPVVIGEAGFMGEMKTTLPKNV
ncbi:MAG: histidine phosphatase family protein [Clostridia bacterium]|nr:histidine phosphatase family protein [Clostridia bacterium]